MLLPLLVAVGVGFYALQQMSSAMDFVAGEAIDQIAPVNRLQQQVHALIDEFRFHHRPVETVLSREVRKVIGGQYRQLLTVDFSSAGEYQAMENSHRDWQQAIAFLAYDDAGEDALRERLLRHLEAAERKLVRVRQMALAEMVVLRGRILKDREATLGFLTAVLLLALSLSLMIGAWLSRSVLEPVRSLKEGARLLGEGELSARVAEVGHDELADLARTFNLMAQKLEKSHQELASLSAVDYLTGLNNVREFYRLFHEETRRAERYGHAFSLLILDIDRFKEINDTFGHQLGDYVLQEVARRLRELVRINDHAARIGGDEFTILLPETDGEEAAELAERIREFFSGHAIALFDHPESAIRITVSIGLATFPRDARDANSLFARADAALYRAKEGGRNLMVTAAAHDGGNHDRVGRERRGSVTWTRRSSV
ncbi:diguanylate cyclase (GGDEF)-like protein [Geothermobacter ehrlichii]|uniref:diguanylate cyclase n=2 Tax=Geothermobacter ehrlichii TaxID=213224 RepID=A0A5D3WHW3_9BACT|nr:diguanylate cyclase (GGDEF)-like protein [Geothermobacter ehrlichii]